MQIKQNAMMCTSLQCWILLKIIQMQKIKSWKRDSGILVEFDFSNIFRACFTLFHATTFFNDTVGRREAVVSTSAAQQFGASVSHFSCYNAAMATFTTSYCLWQIKAAVRMHSERRTDHDSPEGNLLHMLPLTLRKPALFGHRWSLEAPALSELRPAHFCASKVF